MSRKSTIIEIQTWISLVALNLLTDWKPSNSFSAEGWSLESGESFNATTGDDTIKGGTAPTATNNADIGIDNKGTISTGAGKDNLEGYGKSVGIFNSGTIKTGSSDDSITGVKTAAGNGYNIDNTGAIETGSGADRIIGRASSYGIHNSGTINMGSDKDVIDAGIGGYSGGGSIDMASGDDTAKGFGAQIVLGGGVGNFKDNDVLALYEGAYYFRQSTSKPGYHEITSYSVASTTMFVNGFESIAGLDANGSVFSPALFPTMNSGKIEITSSNVNISST